MNTDTVADLLVRIKNGYLARKLEVTVPASTLKESILKVLKKYEFIDNYELQKDQSGKAEILIQLRYEKGHPAVEGIKRVSRPSLRKYIKGKEIRLVRNGYGISIISTSKGVMAGHEAYGSKLGGEVIAEVW